MKRVQDWLLRFRWQKLLLVWGVFLLIAAVLFAERSGVQYTHSRFRLSYLPQEQAISKAQALQEQPATCLLLCDTRQSGVDDARELFTQLLQDMKVAADVVDLAEVSVNDLPAPENYQTAVVLMPNVEPLGEELLRLMNWVEDGGGLLLYCRALGPECGGIAQLHIETEPLEVLTGRDTLLGGREGCWLYLYGLQAPLPSLREAGEGVQEQYHALYQALYADPEELLSLWAEG